MDLVVSGKMPLRNHHWLISESKNQKLGVKFKLPDPVLESAVSSNMSEITSYFPWQKSGQLFKEKKKKICVALSVDFWFLLNIIFCQKLADSVKKEGMMNGETQWKIKSLMSSDKCMSYF